MIWGQILYQDQEIEVHDLPWLMACLHDPRHLLLTSLDRVFQDREVCCGHVTTLGDSARRADPYLSRTLPPNSGAHICEAMAAPYTSTPSILPPML